VLAVGLAALLGTTSQGQPPQMGVKQALAGWAKRSKRGLEVDPHLDTTLLPLSSTPGQALDVSFIRAALAMHRIVVLDDGKQLIALPWALARGRTNAIPALKVKPRGPFPASRRIVEVSYRPKNVPQRLFATLRGFALTSPPRLTTVEWKPQEGVVVLRGPSEDVQTLLRISRAIDAGQAAPTLTLSHVSASEWDKLARRPTRELLSVLEDSPSLFMTPDLRAADIDESGKIEGLCTFRLRVEGSALLRLEVSNAQGYDASFRLSLVSAALRVRRPLRPAPAKIDPRVRSLALPDGSRLVACVR
jgi:hypothetical protein